MKYIIKESEWYRGQALSALLTTDGRKCCLGFVAEQCGLSRQEILGKLMPFNTEAFSKGEKWPAWMYENVHYLSIIALANDSRGYSNEERKAKLQSLFAIFGDELEFIP